MLNPKRSHNKVFYEITLEVKMEVLPEQSKGKSTSDQIWEMISEAIRKHLGKIRSAQIQF